MTSKLVMMVALVSLTTACGRDAKAAGATDAGRDSGTKSGPDAGKQKEATVDFAVPASGGTVEVASRGEMPTHFDFPAGAAGKMVSLTPVAATDIGWPTGQFAEVIRMEPDGATFAEPVVIRPASGDVIVLDFPSADDKSKPEALPLNANGDGFLLSHFSTLAVVPAQNSCDGHSGWVVGDAAEAQTHCTEPEFPTYIRFDCNAHAYCVTIDAHCCARAGATACHLGDRLLSVSFSAAEYDARYPYCGDKPTQTNAGAGGHAAGGGSGGADSGGAGAGGAGSGGAGSGGAGGEAAAAGSGGETSVGGHGGAAAGSGGAGGNTSTHASCDDMGTWVVSGNVPSAEFITGAWANAGDSDLWAVGKSTTNTGLIAHWDGKGWSSITKGASGSVLNAVWGSGSTETIVYAVGSGGKIYRYGSGSWSNFPSPPTTADLYAIWGTDDKHFWVVGANGAAFYFAYEAWEDHSIVSSDTNHIGTLRSVWGASVSDVWVSNDTGVSSANDYVVQRYASGSWSAFAPSSYYSQAVWGAASGDVWAVGYSKGASGHFNGSSWTASTAPAATSYLKSVWGRGSSDVWTVGDMGQIDHWNGTEWSACAHVTALGLNAVVGTDSTVWAFGSGGVVLRNDGP